MEITSHSVAPTGFRARPRTTRFRNLGSRLYRGFLELFIYSSIWTAGGIAALVVFSGRVLGLPPQPGPTLLVFFSALFVYNLDHVVDSKVQKIPEEHAQRYFRSYRVLVGLVVVAVVTGLLVSRAPRPAQWVFAGYTCTGLLYGLPIFPGRRDGRRHWYRLKDIPFIKSWLVAAALTLGAVGLPVAWWGRSPDLATWHLALFVYVFTVSNTHMFDVRDIESDRDVRLRTLPITAGVRRTKRAVILLNLVMLALMSWGWAEHLTEPHPEVVICTAVTVLYVMLISTRTPRTAYGVLIDGCFYLPMVLSWMCDGFS